MHVTISGGRLAAATGCVCAVTLLAATPASAGMQYNWKQRSQKQHAHTQGSSDNHGVSATVSFTTSSSGSSSKGSGNSGPLTSTDTNWTPPGCW
jgi:hypothetical protein